MYCERMDGRNRVGCFVKSKSVPIGGIYNRHILRAVALKVTISDCGVAIAVTKPSHH